MAHKRSTTTEETPAHPKSTGPTMLAHLPRPAPRPKRPATRAYPTAALVLAAAKNRGAAQARPAINEPAAAAGAMPPPSMPLRRAWDRWAEGSNSTVDSMTRQGIDPATAECLHRIHIQQNTVWACQPQPQQIRVTPAAAGGRGPDAAQQPQPQGDPGSVGASAPQPEPAAPAVLHLDPIPPGPSPEWQRIGHLKKEELFDLAIALTRGQDLRIDTLEQNGANSMLHGTMETLQHGKCLVKIPTRAMEIVKVVDHPH